MTFMSSPLLGSTTTPTVDQERMTLKATTTEVNQEAGTFTALVSAWIEDRMKDTILPTAYEKTIAAWRKANRNLPLLFEHSVTAIGSIDPFSMHTNEEGLVVSGEVDRSTDEGKQVWRMIKANTASFSIGFASESRPRKGGGREITEIDLLEVSATSTPINPRARVLDWKSSTKAGPRYSLPDGRVVDYDGLVAYTGVRAEIERKKAEPVTPITIASFKC